MARTTSGSTKLFSLTQPSWCRWSTSSDVTDRHGLDRSPAVSFMMFISLGRLALCRSDEDPGPSAERVETDGFVLWRCAWRSQGRHGRPDLGRNLVQPGAVESVDSIAVSPRYCRVYFGSMSQNVNCIACRVCGQVPSACADSRHPTWCSTTRSCSIPSLASQFDKKLAPTKQFSRKYWDGGLGRAERRAEFPGP